MHEGEIGKSRARALICWPVNQCSLEDLVNISWLSFTFSFFKFHLLLLIKVRHSFNGSKQQQQWKKILSKKTRKKKKKQTTHTMNTIQLLLSHATVRELHNCSRDIHFSLNHGNAWVYEVASRLLVKLI